MIALTLALLGAAVDLATIITATATAIYTIDRNRQDNKTIRQHGHRAKTHQ